MLTEAELQKQWESLTFTDDFIFSRVMHDENICRQVVELILGVRIGKIVYLSAQDEHKTDPDSMRIIMDVFLRDDNRIITVEMQTGRKKELPKRSRYYQSVADVSTTPTGVKYRNLPDNILIFICTFDPFDRAFPRYTFQYTCDEDPTLKLQDGSLRIFLNATANHLDSLDQKLQAFYHYLQEGAVESELARTISESITTLKNDSLERRHYMTWAVKMADARYDGYDEGYEKGISIGLERGLATGREEGISIGLERGREEGISVGIERGAYQTKLETARKLLSEGLAPQMVVRCTDLPLETVLELAQEQ